ncbi:MAG: amidohydrolase [Robiginitomaculum sp.]|nr:MAG: amidohydrolase [Robiginitomaculum sp.]
MGRTLYTNIQIFDGSGADLYPGEVLVEGNKITAVNQGTDEKLSTENAFIIDGKGATLMPGMVEAHAHLTWPTNVERTINAMKLPIEEHVLVTAQNARITLDYGFTSAYSAGSVGEKIEPHLRDMINAGHIPGPRLRASALEKGMEDVMGVPEGYDPTHDRSIEGLRQYIRDMKKLGCDTVKIMLSSDEGFQLGGSERLLYTQEEITAIGETAREENIWLACHSQSTESVKMACRAGFRNLFHCIHIDEEGLDLMEARKDDLFMSPAPGLLYARIHEAQDFGIGPKEARKMGAYLGLESNQKNIPKMRKRGIRVLPGGDYGFPYNPIGRNARDLDIFVKMFGFTTHEALVAATKHGGELVDWPVGMIKANMLADILLIDGDPTKDITVLQDLSKILSVMKDGKFHRAPPRRYEVFA